MVVNIVRSTKASKYPALPSLRGLIIKENEDYTILWAKELFNSNASQGIVMRVEEREHL